LPVADCFRRFRVTAAWPGEVALPHHYGRYKPLMGLAAYASFLPLTDTTQTGLG